LRKARQDQEIAKIIWPYPGKSGRDELAPQPATAQDPRRRRERFSAI
jgi:hypothetical protein